MAKEIFVVTVPQLGVNDEEAIIGEWYVADGKKVSVGEQLCALETAKAVYDVEAQASGYIVQLVEVQQTAAINQPIALIGPDLKSLKSEKSKYRKRAGARTAAWSVSDTGVRATQKASDLAVKLGVDLLDISVGGIIREKDVLAYHEKSTPTEPSEVGEITWRPQKKPVVVFGAGGGGVTLKECLDSNHDYETVCFVDDDIREPIRLCGLPVYNSSVLTELIAKGVTNVACDVTNGEARLRILKDCEKLGMEVINAIHAESYVSPSVTLGKGNHIKAGAIVDANCKLGDGCIIDNGAIVAYNNTIGDGCHIAPGASLGNDNILGDLTVIGIGTSVATGIKIGRSCIIGVGSSVVHDIPDASIVEGVPGKVVGKRKVS